MKFITILFLITFLLHEVVSSSSWKLIDDHHRQPRAVQVALSGPQNDNQSILLLVDKKATTKLVKQAVDDGIRIVDSNDHHVPGNALLHDSSYLRRSSSTTPQKYDNNDESKIRVIKTTSTQQNEKSQLTNFMNSKTTMITTETLPADIILHQHQEENILLERRKLQSDFNYEDLDMDAIALGFMLCIVFLFALIVIGCLCCCCRASGGGYNGGYHGGGSRGCCGCNLWDCVALACLWELCCDQRFDQPLPGCCTDFQVI